MVYRGKPSPRCSSCRLRKLKCDRRQPSCSQCVRLNQECPGYMDPKAVRFCHQTTAVVSKARGRAQKAPPKSSPPAQSPNENALLPLNSSFAASAAALGQEPTLAWNNSAVDTSYFGLSPTSSCSSSSSSSPSPEFLPTTISPTPMMRNQIVSTYLRNFFPQHDAIDKSQFVITGICTLPQKSVMLEKACSALSCVFLGKTHRNEQVLQRGLQLYNHAIQHMSNAISHGVYTDDLVYTIVIFQQIQTHHCPNGLGEWLAHMDGLRAIKKYYHQKIPTNPLMAAIFGQHQKLRAVLTEFTQLSDKTKASLEEPDEGGPLSSIINLLAEVSRIAAAIDTADVSDQNACQSLLDDCFALEHDHMNIYAEFNIPRDPPTYARGELKTRTPPTDDLFGPAYRFESINDAVLYTILWLSLSFVYPLLHKTQKLARREVAALLGNGDDEAHRLSTFYVSKAARCLPYCGQEGTNSWGVLYAILCASQASRVYSHAKDWERFLWAQDVFDYVERLGFDKAARFHDIWWNYWFEPHKHDEYRVMDYIGWEQEHGGCQVRRYLPGPGIPAS